ncbi:MAG: UDP-N-acetylmuramyl-tripeptide synthetase, partial [Patescibacteria group bacterium]|nr:UDP-N-acetylmuramyl-tripeptide synthetase [Patescibacteria group bacterium]
NKNSQNYLVLEVTSHSIHQNRIWGIPIKIAGITNITHEHLDYHKTYENYLNVKAKLLKKAEVAVINRDDYSYDSLFKILRKKQSKKIITYGLNSNAAVNPKTFGIPDSIWGEYNKYNALLAASICQELGLSDKEIKKAMESFKMPKGRAEIVYKENFSIMIDFAHTPNAFKKLLSALRPKVKGKIIHVFGSAGLRDKTKRPLMGEISASFADFLILTSEDPRSESVERIMDGIESGISKEQKEKIVLERIKDRQKAINRAVSLAKKGDFVVITGKAHEKSMNMGQGELPWDEFKAVEFALSQKNKDHAD